VRIYFESALTSGDGGFLTDGSDDDTEHIGHLPKSVLESGSMKQVTVEELVKVIASKGIAGRLSPCVQSVR
jgi:hypothetical protein